MCNKGYRIGLNLTYAEVPRGWRLALEFVRGEVTPTDKRHLFSTGHSSQAFGTPSVDLRDRKVAPSGFQEQAIGVPYVWNLDRYISAGGITSKLAWGRPTVQNLKRFITPSGLLATQYGTPLLQGGVWPLNTTGFNALSVPNGTWVSRSPRFIEPNGVPWNFYTQHQVGTHQSVKPDGFDATEWGTRIIPEAQNLYPQGFVPEMGTAWVSLGTRYLHPVGFKFHAAEEQRFGFQHVWNWQRYFDISTDPNDPYFSGETFGPWTSIENRNKVITHHSTSPGALPSPQIDNAARPLLPSGIAAPGPGVWEKTADVSHRIRNIYPDGLLSESISRWSVVANGARLVKPIGSVFDTFGNGLVWNNRRWLTKAGDLDATQWGNNRVSPGITPVTFDPRYTIEPPRIDLPDVRLNTRYVDVSTGIDAYRTGGQHLRIHWNIAYPSWTHDDRHYLGTPGVRNVTPEVRQMGRNSEEFGEASIRTQWREVVTLETYATQFGKARIADRRLWIEPLSVGSIVLSDKHKVFNLDPDPPGMQKIVIESHQSITDHGFGTPTTNARSIFPKWVEDDFDLMGSPWVRLQGVYNASVGDKLWPDPPKPTVWLRTRLLDAAPPAGAAQNAYMAVGTPRLSPHTVYAVVEAPQQAIQNHVSPGQLHYVDQRFVGGSIYWLHGVGTPAIGHRYRYVRPSSNAPMSALGNPNIRNKHICIKPEGILSMKFGRPVLLGFTRNVNVVNDVSELQNPESPEHKFGERFGTAWASHRVREVKPTGIASSNKFDRPVIDYFHRFVKPAGWLSQQVSSYSGSQNPYQWQHIRVGPLVPNYVEGFDVAEFGEPWVSLRVRDVGVSGFTATEMGPSEDMFAKRLRVSYKDVFSPPARTISTLGADAVRIGYPGLMNLTQYIRPDGDMTNFRKGAPNL